MSIAPGGTLTIAVDSGHIEEGDVQSIETCPIALAVESAYGVTAEVHNEVLILPCFGVYAPLPLAAYDFIYRFDNEMPVEPFTFSVTLDEWGGEGDEYEDEDE